MTFFCYLPHLGQPGRVSRPMEGRDAIAQEGLLTFQKRGMDKANPGSKMGDTVVQGVRAYIW